MCSTRWPAVEAVGIERRDDLYWTLHACLIKRHEHSALFDQAFTLFWRDPRIRERLLKALLPTVELPDEGRVDGEQLARRLQDAIAPERKPTPKDEEQAREEVTLDASLTYSDEERLRNKDFEQMTAEEVEQAKRIMARLRLPIMEVPTRRLVGDSTGHKIDLRATMRAALRPAVIRSPCPAVAAPSAIRPWWCCATYRARWSNTRACCCISCMRLPTIATASMCFCSAPG